jgi:hypothetical protein
MFRRGRRDGKEAEMMTRTRVLLLAMALLGSAAAVALLLSESPRPHLLARSGQ